MVCGQCSKRTGASKCSRCKMMTYCSRECQVAHWPVHKVHCKPIQLSPQKLQLHFSVNKSTKPVSFFEDIPILFCQRDAPRELTSRWVSNLVDTREEEVLAQSSGRCTYCSNPAVALKTTLAVALHENPPTALVSAQRLCSRDASSSCALMAETNVQDTINSPDFPSGGEVYQA
ncbi:hypothetical protein DFH08DRAFT_864228 [Mycena albidolilacea]|uniref:MYND-type domain-containing protein n=1 Tax=Mycena albidolilacea TaxID=1033008 RepID=A0AAD7A464_9AGAR|nr:hypothetical protein DFH08DRAFT_864228 [Mycena albidolilacea]